MVRLSRVQAPQTTGMVARSLNMDQGSFDDRAEIWRCTFCMNITVRIAVGLKVQALDLKMDLQLLAVATR